MVFSQDGFIERGQQGGSQRPETSIFSNNFGGLNKIASPLNVPFEDSPDLLNIDVDVSGNLIRRKGTRIVNWDKNPGSVTGISVIPFTTGLGYNLLVIKQSTILTLYEVVNDVASWVMQKNNVFSSDAADVRANFISTNEVEPRLILTTGANPPVQLKFVEQQRVVTSASGATSVVFSNAERYANATTSNLLVFVNRVRQTGWGVSYNAGTAELTITGLLPYSAPNNVTFDIIMVSWQWWAESYFYYGDRFSGSSTRTNSASVIDRVVSIPSTLRDGVETMAPTYPYSYPIIAYKSTAFADEYSFDSGRNPANRVEYHHCDGVPYTGAGVTTSSPLFITFGANADGATACDASNLPVSGVGANACPSSMPVVFLRRRAVNFNGARGWSGSDIKVYVNSTVITQSTSAGASGTYADRWYAYDIGLATPVLSTATTAYGLAFAASTDVGLPDDAKVEIVNTKVQYLGSAASSNRGDEGTNLNQDGTWVPIFGIGDFANYASGSFPSNISVYQGRIVLSGFLDNSLRVVFSNQYDSVFPGRNFNSFQIDSTTTAATDPFDLTISSAPDDVTKGLIEWQQSLFVLTRKAVFRIFGGSNSTITSANRIVILVSNVGLINSYSVCRTDKAILYLSDTGVFDLSTNIDSTEYVAGEKSIKLRPLFGIASNPAYESLSWMSFDSTNKIVFLAYPQENVTANAFRLYVYNTFRESWTEYYTPGGFNTFHGTSYTDRSLGLQFGMVLSLYRHASFFLQQENRDFILLEDDQSKVIIDSASTAESSFDLVIVRTGYERYIDYAQHATGTGAIQNIDIPPKQAYRTFTTNGVREYPHARSDTGYAYGAQSMPLTNVQDLSVYLETTENSGVFDRLSFGEDWVKTPNGKIYLLQNPSSRRELRIEPRLPVTNSEEGRALYNGSLSYLLLENSDNILLEDSNGSLLNDLVDTSTVSEQAAIEDLIVFVDNIFKPFSNVNYTTGYGSSFFGNIYQLSILAPLNSTVVVGQAYPTYYYSPTFTQASLAAMKRAKYIYAYFDNKTGLPTYGVPDVNTSSGQSAEELVGQPKQRLNTNLALKYEEDDYTETYYDSYGFSDLVWDDAMFDVDSPTSSYRRHVMFKQPLLGTSYSYQLIAWSYDETTFTLAGYQIMANPRGSRFINWAK